MSIETKRRMKHLFDLIKNNQKDRKEVDTALDGMIKKIQSRDGLLRITGADIAGSVDIFVSEQNLIKTARKLYTDNPEYDFTKCLWLEYPNGDEKRLDEVVGYVD